MRLRHFLDPASRMSIRLPFHRRSHVAIVAPTLLALCGALLQPRNAAGAPPEDFAPLILQDADPAGMQQGLTEFRSSRGKLSVAITAKYDTNDVNGGTMPANPTLGSPALQYLYPRLAFNCKDATHEVLSYAGPLLRVFPGDQVQIQFTNNLVSQRTNLHFHGFSVSPHALNAKGVFGDFVGLPYVRGAAPTETRNYEFTIPRSQPPGPYWYHAHAHGIAEMQVACGMSGAIYVEGAVPSYLDALKQRSASLVNGRDRAAATTAKNTLDEANATLAQLPHHLIVLKDFWTPGLKPVLGPLEQSVNGKVTYSNQATGSPYVIQYGGADQIWEISNQSADLHYVLQFNGQNANNFGFYVIGRDGMPNKAGLTPNLPDNSLMIPPAGRVTVVVPTSALAGETVQVTALHVNTNEDNYFQVGTHTNQNPNPWNLIKLTSNGAPAPTGVTAWPTLAADINTTISNTTAAENAADNFTAKHGINATYVLDQPDNAAAGQLPAEPTLFSFYRLGDMKYSPVKTFTDTYENYEPPIARLVPGKPQRWIIENVTPEWHVFHIHQIHFRVEQFTVIKDANNPETNTVAPTENQGIPFYSKNQPPPTGSGKSIGEPFYSGEVDSVTIPGGTQVWLSLPLNEGPQIAGEFVMHCHLLEHEDNGMMANVVAGENSPALAQNTRPASHLAPLEVAIVKFPKPTSLMDSTGVASTSDVFKDNEFSLVTFGYTTCDGSCPGTVEKCSRVLAGLKPVEQAKISPFFVSIDVDRDSPATLADYMRDHKLAASWKAMLDQDLATSRAFGARSLITKSKDGSVSIRHSTTIYLIDRTMQVRAAFDSEESSEVISRRIQKELERGGA